MQPSIITRPRSLNFTELQENKYLFDRINSLCGVTDYRQVDRFYCFSNGTNCWRFDGFITDAQWRKLAQLCIRFEADISKAVRQFSFETEYISVVDGDHRIDYEVPTMMKGWISNMFFGIDELGNSNT